MLRLRSTDSCFSLPSAQAPTFGRNLAAGGINCVGSGVLRGGPGLGQFGGGITSGNRFSTSAGWAFCPPPTCRDAISHFFHHIIVQGRVPHGGPLYPREAAQTSSIIFWSVHRPYETFRLHKGLGALIFSIGRSLAKEKERQTNQWPGVPTDIKSNGYMIMWPNPNTLS